MNRSRRGTLASVAALAAFLGVLVVTGTAAPAPSSAFLALSDATVTSMDVHAAPMDALLRKCPLDWNRFAAAPRSGVVVDGILVAEGDAAVRRRMVPGESFVPADHEWGPILETHLMCGEDLYNRMGVIVRHYAVVIHTEEGPVAPVIALLSELSERQEAHFEAHGLFAANPAELDWSPTEAARTLMRGLTITLSDGAAGWTAIAQVEGYPATCGVFGGTAEPLAHRAPEHTPICPVAPRNAIR